MNKQTMINEIRRLKKEKNAIILAHYYQTPDIQDIADITGDSYDLSKKAAHTDADVIVFCGVHFMAETAKLLAPEKTVLLPVKDAGCPMADMITADALKAYKAQHPDQKIVCYVNTTAAVKAESDVCVTSSNAEKIIHQVAKGKILYVPDQNLGTYLKDKYALDIELWPGFCCIHHNLTAELALSMKEKHPNAELIVHPEAKLEVLKLADYVGGTKGLLDWVETSKATEFLVGTEEGIIHQMKKRAPHKKFTVLTPDLVCNQMKKITMESLYHALRDHKNVITVDQDIAKKAKRALDQMMTLSESS